MSYCTRFDGTYTDTGGRQQVVDVGSKYRLRVFMHGPVTLADESRHIPPRVDEVRRCHLCLYSLVGGSCLRR
jgi:hypothetical protein